MFNSRSDLLLANIHGHFPIPQHNPKIYQDSDCEWPPLRDPGDSSEIQHIQI